MKVAKSARIYTAFALAPDHADRKRIVQLLDNFQFSGVNGVRKLMICTDICMVLEAMGSDLSMQQRRLGWRGIPLVNVRAIIKQVCRNAYMLLNARWACEFTNVNL